jgi:hypothetical protein
MWAGRFKTPEDLEVAYDQSSKEGRRLSAALKDQQRANEEAIAAMRNEISELKLAAELGPEIPEPTEQEMEAMGPVKAMRAMEKSRERKAKAQQLADAKAKREADAKRYSSDLRAHINKSIEEMKGDTKNFPDYAALQDGMNAIMDLEDQGPQNGPLIVYLAAYGRRALAQAAEASEKSSQSAAQAKAKAQAAAAAAAAPGGSGGSPASPGTKPAIDPDSDEAHNRRLVEAAGRRHVAL